MAGRRQRGRPGRPRARCERSIDSTMKRPLLALVVAAAAMAAAWPPSADAQTPASPSAADARAVASPTVATPRVEVAGWQRDLLQLAFDAASAFPLDPHQKNRSRAQDVVVQACFALGLPDLALAYGSQMPDWRRGCAYADCAFAMAKRGERARALDYVKLAEGVAKAELANPTAQQWRADLIALKVGRAYSALGDAEAAGKATAGIDPSSTTAVNESWADTAAERANALGLADVRLELAAIDADFPRLSLGQQHVVLVTLVRLHARFFADPEVRRFCAERLTVTWATVMPALRLDALADMVRTSAELGDRAHGKDLLLAMRGIVAGHTWRLEDKLPQVSRLAALAHLLGDSECARAEAEAALEAWHVDREKIVNIWRARSLRPLALAWHALGDRAKCQELLALVLEEGMENPNSRPRCDDLVDTCVDLAKHGIEPSPALLTRMHEIKQGLGQPW